MTSQRQIEANRRNAQFSTGPKTLAGKLRVRINAWKHGGRARLLLGPGETMDQYMAHCNQYILSLRPWDPMSLYLVLKIADSDWRIDRIIACEAWVWNTETNPSLRDRKVNRLLQYEYRLQRRSERCLGELFKLLRHTLQQGHAVPQQAPNPMEQSFKQHSMHSQMGLFVQNHMDPTQNPSKFPDKRGPKGTDPPFEGRAG